MANLPNLPAQPGTAPAPAEPADPAISDLCHVQRQGDRVLMSFGCSVPSAQAAGAQGVQLQRQVGLSAAGAAQLQDLLLALLQAPLEPPR